jgi:hypothetical protein
MRNMKGGYEHVVSSDTLRQVGCGPTDIFQQSLSLLCRLFGSRTTRKISSVRCLLILALVSTVATTLCQLSAMRLCCMRKYRAIAHRYHAIS